MVFDPCKATDYELGKLVLSMTDRLFSPSEAGKQVREWFDHSCQGQVDNELAEKVSMFARYMRDAWGNKEGQSCFVAAMQVMSRFKRHEDRLRSLVEGVTVVEDVPILAACEILRNGSFDKNDKEGVNHE